MGNPEKRKMILKKIVTNTPSIISLIPIIISILTLHEMQVERNHAYLPRVMVEESVCRWDTDCTLLKQPYSAIMYINGLPLFLPSIEGLTLGAGEQVIHEDPYIIVSNIGNGIAENITYIFDENNEWAKEIIQLLNKMDSESSFSWLEDKTTGEFHIQRYGCNFGGSDNSCTSPYLLSNCEKTNTVYIPGRCGSLLSIYIDHIYYFPEKFLGYLDSIPDLPIKISYYDIQGNKYEREIMLKIRGEMAIKDKEEDTYYFNIYFSYNN